MFKRKKYYYDGETFQYVPVKTNYKSLITLGAKCFIISLFLLLVGYNYWIRFEEIYFKNEQNKIARRLKTQTVQLGLIEEKLNKIHQNDPFYKSILELPKIESAEWEGGTGGSNKYVKIVPPELRDLAILKDKIRHKLELQKESFNRVKELAIKNSEILKHIPTVRPLNGRIISGYGYRNDPFFGHVHFHAGIDIVAPIGTGVNSVGDGTVITSGYPESGYGLQVEIDHGYGYVSKYAHLSRSNVTLGQKVKRGQLIGLTGSSGYSTGPHLHYEVIKNGLKENPCNYIRD